MQCSRLCTDKSVIKTVTTEVSACILTRVNINNFTLSPSNIVIGQARLSLHLYNPSRSSLLEYVPSEEKNPQSPTVTATKDALVEDKSIQHCGFFCLHIPFLDMFKNMPMMILFLSIAGILQVFFVINLIYYG